MSNEVIEHNGIVESIGPDVVTVRILQTSACAECKARSFCASNENKEKIIEVYKGDSLTQGRTDENCSLKVGDEVVVCASALMGRDAVVLAFVVPLVIMLAGLFVTLKITGNEPLSALVGILVLLVYYIVLYTQKARLKRRMKFWLKS